MTNSLWELRSCGIFSFFTGIFKIIALYYDLLGKMFALCFNFVVLFQTNEIDMNFINTQNTISIEYGMQRIYCEFTGFCKRFRFINAYGEINLQCILAMLD